MSLNIDDSRIALAIPPFLRLAFRPFFLCGALFSILAIAWWCWFWLHPSAWNPYGGPIWWHGHEMIFGFAAAIVVGFLLTAVQTWTGVIGLRGAPLSALLGLWLAGRLVLAFGSSLPSGLTVGIDSLFLLSAAIAMAYPVLKVKQWRNIVFVPILLGLAFLNLMSHWGVLSEQPLIATKALHGAILLITLVVGIIGGRVMPMFTANGTGTQKVLPIKWLELSSLFSLLAIAVLAFVGYDLLPPAVLITVLVFAAVANSWRFLRWGFWRCWRHPLLWSLHLSYAFIPLGLVALALHHAGLLASGSAALHCFAVGAIGGMILAMISRVSLGHTGRSLEPPAFMSLAFALILVAALVRVVLPVFLPGLMSWAIGLAGGAWVLAYGIFLICYAPMLLAPRLDGRPG
jgi:uncharacterized protein involved in response to NO